MSNKRINKAYVRYDGNGRVIAGSLILNRFKPQVGNWSEIPAYECCNPSPVALPLRMLFSSILEVDALVGDSSSVADWNTFFDLPALGGAFTSVEVVGNEVKLYGGSGIKVKPGLMYNGGNETFLLLSINDEAGCITSVGGDAFSYCGALTDVNLPECTIVYGYQDSPNSDYGGLGYCQALVNINIPKLVTVGSYGITDNIATSFNFPLLTTAGSNGFSGCASVTNISLPLLNTAGQYCFVGLTSLTTASLPQIVSIGAGCFDNCTSLTTITCPNVLSISNQAFSSCGALTSINLSSCTDLGGSVANDGVFTGIVGNTITLTVPSALMTCDAGSPDGDIQWLQLNNTVTVVTV